MDNDTGQIKGLIDHLAATGTLERQEYSRLLSGYTSEILLYANKLARKVSVASFGHGIFIRGLIELSNYCRNNCYYCGIRRSNPKVERYRLTKEQILECCRTGYELGIRTFVMQGGEDAGMSDAFIADVTAAVRDKYPDCAITLSLGERSHEAYRMFYDAGANRYLLRHEAANEELYGKLHPAEMSFGRRMESLRILKETGYQTGAGMMIGAPGQSIDDLVDDILFIERFKPEMVGMGPYLPQAETPLAGHPAGSTPLTLMMVSIVRLMLPNALIPATTALASNSYGGREAGILAGANVVMPNLSPQEYRAKYAIYDNKKSFGSEAAEGLRMLEEQLCGIGYHISYDRGDFSKA